MLYFNGDALLTPKSTKNCIWIFIRNEYFPRSQRHLTLLLCSLQSILEHYLIFFCCSLFFIIMATLFTQKYRKLSNQHIHNIFTHTLIILKYVYLKCECIVKRIIGSLCQHRYISCSDKFCENMLENNFHLFHGQCDKKRTRYL